MATTDLVVQFLERSRDMVRSHLSELSDAEMLVRPVPNANHPTWQLGHLCVAETRMMNAIGVDLTSLLPTGFKEKFAKETAKLDDPTQFPNKAELLAVFEKVREGTIAAVGKLPESDLSRSIPSPFRPGTETTVGFMIHMPAMHTTLHVGQFQVARRNLGKPVMF